MPAAVFAVSASWEPASWDTAELQGVPYILGITHPTGFPLYVMLGYVWSHAIAISTVAWRMNAMSGIAIAVACVAAYGTARQFGATRAIALLATLWFAFSRNVWAHAARAEAQDLAVMCAALAIYLFVRWMREGNDRRFLAAFGLCGLAMAAHPNALWILPGLVVGAAIAPRRPSPRLIAGGLALCIAGLALYLYLPLRSAYVVAHHLDPTAALPGTGGGIFWNYNNPSSFGGFVREVTRKRNAEWRVFARGIQSDARARRGVDVHRYDSRTIRCGRYAAARGWFHRRMAARPAGDARSSYRVSGGAALLGYLSQRKRR